MPALSSGRPISAASRTAPVAQQHFLDVSRVPVHAVDEEALGQASPHEHVALRIHEPDVTGVQPAAAQRLVRLLRPVPVPRHVPATQADLADVAGRNLVAGVVEDAHLLVRQRAAARRQPFRRQRVVRRPSPTNPPSSLWP